MLRLALPARGRTFLPPGLGKPPKNRWVIVEVGEQAHPEGIVKPGPHSLDPQGWARGQAGNRQGRGADPREPQGSPGRCARSRTTPSPFSAPLRIRAAGTWGERSVLSALSRLLGPEEPRWMQEPSLVFGLLCDPILLSSLHSRLSSQGPHPHSSRPWNGRFPRHPHRTPLSPRTPPSAGN